MKIKKMKHCVCLSNIGELRENWVITIHRILNTFEYLYAFEYSEYFTYLEYLE